MVTSMAVQQSGYVQANGIAIYFEEYGDEDGTPLILLHGGTATLQSWQGHIPTLASHFRVIVLDSRGHGKTNNPDGQLSYTIMADDVVAFIQAKNLNRPLIFGYSDGGQIALEIGIRHPNVAGALILGGTCYKFQEQYFEALKGFGFAVPGVLDFERMQADEPEWVDSLKTEHERAGDPDYWKTLMQQISLLWWNVQDYKVEELQAIESPTLILQGDRDEGVDVEQAVEMYRAIPNAELAVLPNAAHGDLNAIADSIVIDFLKRHTDTGTAS